MIKKISLLLLLIIICLLFCDNTVFAMEGTWINDAKFSRGVKNTCYYVNSTANAYVSRINSAARSWAVLDNKINNTAVSSNKGTHIDIYGKYIGSDQWLDEQTLAYVYFYDENAKPILQAIDDEPRINYYYVEMIINRSNAKLITSGTIAHEMGHAYGLSHRWDYYSIMHPYNDVLVTTPQASDNAIINYLYPNG